MSEREAALLAQVKDLQERLERATRRIPDFGGQDHFAVSPHGGRCCGVSHVYFFPYFDAEEPPKEWQDLLRENIQGRIMDMESAAEEHFGYYDEEGDFIRETPRWVEENRPFSHLIEVVLIDSQMQKWGPSLKSFGFELVKRWFNDNSGNWCNLLVYCTSNKEETPLPFEW